MLFYYIMKYIDKKDLCFDNNVFLSENSENFDKIPLAIIEQMFYNKNMLYICQCCDAHFSRPSYYYEYQGECFGSPAYETIECCPFCGGSYEGG